MGLCAEPASAPVLMQWLMVLGLCAELVSAPVSHAKREWGKPRQSLMGGTPKIALPPQDRNGAFDQLRIKFATGRTSASLCNRGNITSNLAKFQQFAFA